MKRRSVLPYEAGEGLYFLHVLAMVSRTSV